MGGGVRTGQSRHKPIWLNYAQWLLGPTGRWHSWNRNEGQSLEKPPLFVYCGWPSSALLLLRFKPTSHAPAVGIRMLDGLAQLWKSRLVRVVGLGVWMFPVGWHSLHVWEELSVWGVCFSPVPSLLRCAFWLFSPRPDRPAAPRHPLITDWRGQEWPIWHVSQSCVSINGFKHRLD